MRVGAVTETIDGEVYPIAQVIKRRPNSSNSRYEIATIRCPLCGKIHEHSFDPKVEGTVGTEVVGHRIAHCCDPYAANNREKVNHGYVLRI